MSYDTQDADLEVTDSAPNITTDSNQVGSAEPAWRELKSYDPHCFACGQESSMGLKMEFSTNGEKMRSNLVVPAHLRGWSKLVHGGIITTALDEMMAWTGIHFLNRFLLTRDIKVRFKLPLYVEEPVTVYGWIAEHSSERKVTLAAEIINAKGQQAAKAEGDFALFTPEKFASMNLVPEEELVRLQQMFSISQQSKAAD